MLFGKPSTSSTTAQDQDPVDADEGDIVFDTSSEDGVDGGHGGYHYDTIEEALHENYLAFKADSREAPGETPGDHRGQYALKPPKKNQATKASSTTAAGGTRTNLGRSSLGGSAPLVVPATVADAGTAAVN
jgi:hypothetical protein